MKTVDISKTENKATFFVDICGDIFDSEEDAAITGVAGSICVDNGYPGSLDEWRKIALKRFNEA